MLYNKTRHAQWHIDGVEYYSVHKTFETQFERLENFISRIAKRLGLFGHYVPTPSPSFLAIAHLKDGENNKTECKELLKELLADHKTLIETLNGYIHHFSEECNATETSDFIDELKKDHEKIAGLIQSHL